MSTSQAKNDAEATGQAASPSAFLTDIYRRYCRELYLFIYKTFGAGPPDPEDVVQQVFVQFAALDDFKRIENPRAFLYRAAQNIVINSRQRDATAAKYRKTTLQENLEQKKSDDISPEHVLLERETYNVVEQAIRGLPERRRQLLLLHRLHGLSYAEIARQTGLSESAVKKHVALGVAACGIALEQAESDAAVKKARK